MYTSLTEVPEVIQHFYFEEIVREPTGEKILEEYTYEGEAGEILTGSRWVDVYADVTYVKELVRPEGKSQADLDRVIGLGKPQAVLDKFAEMVGIREQWEWFDLYKEYLEELAEVEEYNLDKPLEVESEIEGNEPTILLPKELPTEPVQPSVRSGSDVLAPYVRDLFKKSRTTLVESITVEVDGMIFDGDETSQARMARAILVLGEGETTLWVLSDNTPVDVTKAQLTLALKLAGIAQTEVWVNG